MNLYNKCSAKTYCCLVINTSLASDNPLRLEKYFLKNIKTNHNNRRLD